MKPSLFLILTGFFLAGCGTSVKQVGTLGSHSVWKISDNDFLTASRLLVVVDEYGNVVASTGGLTNGPGAVTLQLAGTVIMATAVGYAAHTLSDALRDLQVSGKVSGQIIPNEVTLTPNTVPFSKIKVKP